MTVKTYDPKCQELAEHMLHEERPIDRWRLRSLSLAFQQTYEDWKDDAEREVSIRRRADGGCTYCDAHRDDKMMPWHDASPACECGRRDHCTCNICH